MKAPHATSAAGGANSEMQEAFSTTMSELILVIDTLIKYDLYKKTPHITAWQAKN